jgi:monoamine oxidase
LEMPLIDDDLSLGHRLSDQNWCSGGRPRQSSTGLQTQCVSTQVAVIGAGAAGLQAADLLRRARIPHFVLESNARAGGRIYSRQDQGTELGLVIDEGANLINSTDHITLGLLQRFHIPIVQRSPPGADHMVYLFDDQIFSQAEMEMRLFRGNQAALWWLNREQRARQLGEDHALLQRLTDTSISNYLRDLGAGRLLTRLLQSFFWSEYGKLLPELNAHVLHDYFAIDFSKRHFKLIPYTDEAYTVPLGTGQIAVELERLNRSQILYEHTVTGVHSRDDKRLEITCSTPERQLQVVADFVLFSAPLHAISSMIIDVEELDCAALQQAREASYASGVKLHLKFRLGFHDLYKWQGIFITDTGEQIWVSSLGQPSGAGLLTVLTGPMPTGKAAVNARVRRLLPQLERLAPGLSALYAGVERTDAPKSYSGALRPGETNQLGINADHVRWITIGEASGGELQGYLEGALASATRRTKQLIAKLKLGQRQELLSATR